MAKIANVALTDTFNTWRTRTNTVLDRVSQFAINNSSLYANTLTSNVAFTAKGTATVTGLFTASGRAVVGTNLGVTGNTTVTGLTTASGRLTVGTNLNVSGNSTIGGAGKTANVQGWFGVAGRQSISTNLFVGGNTVVMGTASGFGTSSPSYRVHVSGSAIAQRTIGIESTSTTGSSPPLLAFLRSTATSAASDFQGSIQWTRTLTDSTTITGSILAFGSNDSTAPSMSFYYNPYTSHIFQVNATEKVKITNGGLHVTANSTFNGTVSTATANILQQTLSDAGTVAWNTASGQIATVTIGGNRTMGAPTNLKVGTYILHIYQDGTGGRTMAWNAIFKWTAGVAPPLSAAAGAHDVFSFVSDGTYLYGSFMPDVR